MEAAVVERLRRQRPPLLHASLVHAPLIYTSQGQQALREIYQSYIDVATKAGLPLLICTPTWRANNERVLNAEANPGINMDALEFMKIIRDDQGVGAEHIWIGGLIGCKNDCYRPEEALSANEAREFHREQIQQLIGADFLIAQTIPSLSEATGIAQAMSLTGRPYIISFVIARDGRILDQTNLNDAFKHIDNVVSNKPLGYMINCAHPSFLCADYQDQGIFKRLIGYQANAAALDHSELDESNSLVVDDIKDWGVQMQRLNTDFGIKILGGCCGTDVQHLQSLI